MGRVPLQYLKRKEISTAILLYRISITRKIAIAIHLFIILPLLSDYYSFKVYKTYIILIGIVKNLFPKDRNVFKDDKCTRIMNKWTELILGLILVIAAILVMMQSPSWGAVWDFKGAAWGMV